MQVARWSCYHGQRMSNSEHQGGGTDIAGILKTVDDFRRQRRGQLRLSMGRGFPGQRSVRVRHYFGVVVAKESSSSRLLWP